MAIEKKRKKRIIINITSMNQKLNCKMKLAIKKNLHISEHHTIRIQKNITTETVVLK